jgi:hypothetical protein
LQYYTAHSWRNASYEQGVAVINVDGVRRDTHVHRSVAPPDYQEFLADTFVQQ